MPLLKKTAVFWSKNSYGHIEFILRSSAGTTAVLQDGFKEKLKDYYEKFKIINEKTQNSPPSMAYLREFLHINSGFINLLERLKLEAFSGYPVILQTVSHCIYEQRYINAVFGNKNDNGNVLITNYFLPFLNNNISCYYNQMYFWSIIGSMHPSFLMQDNAFYNSVNGYAKEFLTSVCNSYNAICYRLSELKKPIKRAALSEIFADFCILNKEYLEFLQDIKDKNKKIFVSVVTVRLPADFYKSVDHQIAETLLTAEICKNITPNLKK